MVHDNFYNGQSGTKIAAQNSFAVGAHVNSHRFCVAPMMEWTDRHCRYFHRLLSRHARLYTEMVTTGAVLNGDREKLLGFDALEKPVALQLGGSDPTDLATAARIGEDFGYDEINFNVGCPSDRVQQGCFGAALMGDPELVARCVQQMIETVSIPVTVKCRIGIDDQDIEEPLDRFVSLSAEAGCNVFIIHARKAWLQGLSPKENREIPPLNYDRVGRLKERFPHLTIVLNGGIESVDAARDHLKRFDGVMMGRAAYHNPYLLADVDRVLFGDDHPVASRTEILDQLISYVEAQCGKGVRFNQVARHLYGLFFGQAGARAWRRHLSENATRPGAGPEILIEAASHVRDGARLVETASSAGEQRF